MIYNLPVASILHEEVLLEDDFNSELEGWEIISDEDEKSFIKDSHYWMENKTESRWMFYHKKLPVDLHSNNNFIIKAEIELISHKGYGQYGLVWGFGKPHQVLNRFSVSVESNRFSISKFDKDHFHIEHRFSGKYEKEFDSRKKQFFSILCIQDYYYFFLHHYQKPVYICHKSQLKMEGNRFGFYVEPGILMRTDKITVKKLIIDDDFEGLTWMPIGSVLVNGN